MLLSKIKMLTGLTAGLLLCFQVGGTALAAVPKDAPKDIKYILGFYYGNGENILIRENKGTLELLYRTSNKDKDFSKSNVFPLDKQRFDSYLMQESGPMSNTEVTVRFERDQDGYGITCRVGGHNYSRSFVGQTEGERAPVYKFPAKTAEEWTKLRTEANTAVMPATLGTGTQLKLVSAKQVPGLKVASVYATEENIFGAPLYTTSELFMSQQAAEALKGVQTALAEYGYGLMLWDAYRPWSVSKLANLALPEGKKEMLEDPMKKGSTHNTGNAVDVTLYSLATGAPVELSSGFDEPSFRQYAEYPGGTSKQRYLRGLLREIMEQKGFKGIDMEWWHFEYTQGPEAAHQNIPLEQLQ